MGARDWAGLAFKVLGLWLAASGVIGLANIPYVWQMGPIDQTQRAAVLATAFPSLLSLVVGALVWLNASGLAARAVGEDPAQLAARVFGDGTADSTAAPRPLATQPLFALALAVIGVLLIVEAVPLIVYSATMFVRSRQAGTAIFGPDLAQRALIWDAAQKASLAAACTRLLIGAALLAGPARLSAAYTGIRKELRGTLADESPAPVDSPGRDGGS